MTGREHRRARRARPLDKQDRIRWDRGEIADGVRIPQAALTRDRRGEYQIQAAIAALHDDAPAAEETDWPQILAWYDDLVALTDDPAAALSRAVVAGEVDGPLAGLRATEGLDARLAGHHRLDASAPTSTNAPATSTPRPNTTHAQPPPPAASPNTTISPDEPPASAASDRPAPASTHLGRQRWRRDGTRARGSGNTGCRSQPVVAGQGAFSNLRRTFAHHAQRSNTASTKPDGGELRLPRRPGQGWAGTARRPAGMPPAAITHEPFRHRRQAGPLHNPRCALTTPPRPHHPGSVTPPGRGEQEESLQNDPAGSSSHTPGPRPVSSPTNPILQKSAQRHQ